MPVLSGQQAFNMRSSKSLDILSCSYCFLQKDAFGRPPGMAYSALPLSSLLTAMCNQEALSIILADTARFCAWLHLSCVIYCCSVFGSLLQQCSLLAAVHVAVRQHLMLFSWVRPCRHAPIMYLTAGMHNRWYLFCSYNPVLIRVERIKLMRKLAHC